MGRGRGPVHGAPAQAEPSLKAHVQKGKRHRKRAERDTRGEGFAYEETPRVLSFFFFPPPHPREELNSVILGGKATPALSTGSWNKWFVSDLQTLKKTTPL